MNNILSITLFNNRGSALDLEPYSSAVFLNIIPMLLYLYKEKWCKIIPQGKMILFGSDESANVI